MALRGRGRLVWGLRRLWSLLPPRGTGSGRHVRIFPAADVIYPYATQRGELLNREITGDTGEL